MGLMTCAPVLMCCSFFCSRPLFVPPPLPQSPEYPEHQQTDGSASCIDQHINHRSFARGHKSLMKFIRAGIGEYAEQGVARLTPGPWAWNTPNWFAKSPPAEDCQDGVFGQVTTFPEKKDNMIDLFRRKIRHQPMEQGRQDAGGMLKGIGIAGGRKNNGHPDERRQPVSQVCTPVEHTA